MRFVRWIVILLVLIFIILQLIYNSESLSGSIRLVIQILPKRPIIEVNADIWLSLIIVFVLGFGIAILFEVYYWFKYSSAIRSQNRIIKKLRKRLIKYLPAHKSKENLEDTTSTDSKSFP